MKNLRSLIKHFCASPRRGGGAFFIVVLLFLISPIRLDARQFSLEWGCFVDLPQGWEPLEVTDDKATFADVGERAFFQIKVYPSTRFAGGESMFQEVGGMLKADGEGELFSYQGRDAVFTDLLFQAGEAFYRGYGVYVDEDEPEGYDWVVLCFSEAELADAYHFPIISALDSFSMDIDAVLSPGPVSRYYEQSFENPEDFSFDVPFGDRTLEVEASEAAMETTMVTVEREARVLGIYTPEDHDAWQRFYRMIYRDNYRRMDSLYRSLILNGFSPRQDPRQAAEALLSWIQRFDYHRTGTPEDFSTPLEALYNNAGDCDSLGLLYVILMKHFGVDAILMVSDRFGHSMAAVDVSGEGARFPWEERTWIVAETTADVDLGRIAAEVADPAGWLGITFLPELP